MIVSRLKGGMGNQMFQYALGTQLAYDLDCDLKLDLSSLLYRNKPADFVYRGYDLDVFWVDADFLVSPSLLGPLYNTRIAPLAKAVRRLAPRGLPRVREGQFHFNPAILREAREGVIYEGWFQSPKYFAGVEEEIREDFEFRLPLLPESEELLGRIRSTNSICLNVRRTDFLKVDTLNATDRDYFLRGARYLAERVPDARFFVFSDDVAWCRDNILLDRPTEFVDHEHKGYKFGNYMRLMTNCKHFLIPNSSFAWWAAWLSTAAADKQVVAPKNWFTDPSIDTSDLVPAEWTRL